MNRNITVKGIGNITVKPDQTIITMEMQTLDLDYMASMNTADNLLSALREEIMAVGFLKSDIKTTNFSVDTQYERVEVSRNKYENIFRGYQVNHTLKLKFDMDMEKLNSVLTAITTSGANPEFDIKFTVKNPNKVSEDLLKDAVLNAKEKAEVMVNALGSKLGNIICINYDWGEIIFNSPLSPHLEKMDKAMSMDIEPDDINASDTATIVWEII